MVCIAGNFLNFCFKFLYRCCLSCPGGLQRDRIALHCGVYVVLSVMPRWTSARQDCSSLRCICCIVCHAQLDFSETGLLFTEVYMLYCLLCPGEHQRDRIALHLRCICCIVCHAQVDFSETGLLVTEPYFNFTSIKEAMTEIFFEDYQFQSIYKCNRKLSCLLLMFRSRPSWFHLLSSCWLLSSTLHVESLFTVVTLLLGLVVVLAAHV